LVIYFEKRIIVYAVDLYYQNCVYNLIEPQEEIQILVIHWRI